MRSLPLPLSSIAVSLALLIAPAVAAAQDQSTLPIQQRMTPEQFKAAGLDKLSPAELANLNRWMSGTLKVESEKASASALALVKQKAQGFFDFDGNRDAIHATMIGDFTGFVRGRVYKFDNGQEWEVVEAPDVVTRKTNPKVEFRPGMMNTWWMIVDGINKRGKARRVK